MQIVSTATPACSPRGKSSLIGLLSYCHLACYNLLRIGPPTSPLGKIQNLIKSPLRALLTTGCWSTNTSRLSHCLFGCYCYWRTAWLVFLLLFLVVVIVHFCCCCYCYWRTACCAKLLLLLSHCLVGFLVIICCCCYSTEQRIKRTVKYHCLLFQVFRLVFLV